MLKLNVNQDKTLTFDLQLGGVQTEQIDSFLRLSIDGIEYGFPGKVGRESVTVDLPALKSVTPRRLKEGEEVEIKLEIIADETRLIPWRDTVRLSNPIMVEAKIKDGDYIPPFKAKLVQEGDSGDEKQGVRLEQVEVNESKEFDDDFTERLVKKLAERLGMTEKKHSPVDDEIEVDEDDEPIEKAPVQKEHRRIKTRDLLEMTKEDVYAYMERAGTKNEMIQNIIYEQAETEAKSSKPVNVLRQVVKILKKS